MDSMMSEHSGSTTLVIPHASNPPLWLLAELTYKCPLHCSFCYNPLDYAKTGAELNTDEWKAALKQGRELGAVQLGFSGGEPLVRDDLEELIAYSHGLGYYTNLITSGIGLTEARAKALKAAGLDHVQLSFQDSTREMNDFLSSTKTFDLKNKVAGIIKAHGWPMVLNCVLHKHNLAHVSAIIEMAERMGAEYIELANTQYYGWAWHNRAALMPSWEQLQQAEAEVETHKKRLEGKMRIFWVSPDYHEARPKACMSGWGSVFMVVSPDGVALPCHGARMLSDKMGIEFPNVKTQSIKDIWFNSDAFNRYRGTDWMSDTCKGCDQHTKDFGGCRCQAFLLTGDATATDPVCSKSPDHHLVSSAVAQTEAANEHALHFVPRFKPGSATAKTQDGVMWFRTDENSRTFDGIEQKTEA
jgi:PqqA peptide cyclase